MNKIAMFEEQPCEEDLPLLLAEEVIAFFEDVWNVSAGSSQSDNQVPSFARGTLHVTNFRIVFQAESHSSYMDVRQNSSFEESLGSIFNLKRTSPKELPKNHRCVLEISCKTFHVHRLSFQGGNAERQEAQSVIESRCFGNSLDLAFCFAVGNASPRDSHQGGSSCAVDIPSSQSNRGSSESACSSSLDHGGGGTTDGLLFPSSSTSATLFGTKFSRSLLSSGGEFLPDGVSRLRLGSTPGSTPTCSSTSGSFPNSQDAHEFPRNPHSSLALFKELFLEDFTRMGALPPKGDSNLETHGMQWRVFSGNKEFLLCPTYPPFFVVPASSSNIQLRQVAKFRCKGRIPVLSWYDGSTGVSLFRSSQPKSGIFRTSCKDDVELLQQFCSCNKVNPKTITVLDLRPKINAVANSIKGFGTESTSHYPDLELRFLGIHNCHRVRDSYRRLFDLCQQSIGNMNRWLSSLDATCWLDHISTILAGVATTVDTLHSQMQSVLVHCSDGWDRTPQVSSLSMMCLDPFYRTIDGFITLVDREWLHMGHNFQRRVGFSRPLFFTDSSHGPIFVQFIECVWQLTEQFPCSFEFNEDFLLCILEHLYSMRFYNFLGNNVRERFEFLSGTRRNSPCLWEYIKQRQHFFLNPFFAVRKQTSALGSTPAANGDPPFLSASIFNPPTVLFPNFRASSLRFWDRYYLGQARSYSADPMHDMALSSTKLLLLDFHSQLESMEMELNGGNARGALGRAEAEDSTESDFDVPSEMEADMSTQPKEGQISLDEEEEDMEELEDMVSQLQSSSNISSGESAGGMSESSSGSVGETGAARSETAPGTASYWQSRYEAEVERNRRQINFFERALSSLTSGEGPLVVPSEDVRLDLGSSPDEQKQFVQKMLEENRSLRLLTQELAEQLIKQTRLYADERKSLEEKLSRQ